jgi:hypothetical protein
LLEIITINKWRIKMLSKYEGWLQTAKSNESITYHEGYLARDRFFNNTTRDIANLFMRGAENNLVVLFQKRLKHGSQIMILFFNMWLRKYNNNNNNNKER